jgi:signal transduction histidine kinase
MAVRNRPHCITSITYDARRRNRSMALPLAARLYLWLMVVAAGGGLGVLTLQQPEPQAPNLLVVAELAALTVVAQHFPLALGPRRQLDLSLAVHFAIVLVAGMPLAMAVVGASEGLGQGTLMLRRNPHTGKRMRGLYGVLFNTSQAMLAAAVAGQVQAAVLALPAAPFGLLAVPAAAAALYLANTLAVAVMVGLHRGQHPFTVWRADRGWSALQAAGLLLLGFAAAHTAADDPWVPLVMTLPAALTYAALQRTAAAEAAVRARDEFLSVAAHELRTPLTSLQGYAELLLRHFEKAAALTNGGAVDGAQRVAHVAPVDPHRLDRALRTIDAQSKKLGSLINQLLDVSRVQAGKLTVERQPVDLAELAHDVAAELQPMVAPYRLVVQATGPVPAMADRLRIEQVLTNLITNAAKYAGGGDRIEVHVAATRDRRARLTVRDYGVGIPLEQRERIFERYYQADQERVSGGLGIGLYVARQIVELHRGTITVECPPDGGARFVVSLPALKARGEAAATPRAPTAPRVAAR